MEQMSLKGTEKDTKRKLEFEGKWGEVVEGAKVFLSGMGGFQGY